MKACGIVVEYNPFHNGHKYHLEKSRELSGADLVIAVMSGNFLQRGEPAIVNKWARAKMAVENGVDLVIELPSFYSTESAEFFARGALEILNKLRVETLVFGSEIGEIETLRRIVEFSGTEKFSEEIKELMKEGISYPNGMRILIEKEFGEGSLNPNNILGIEYIRAIEKIGSGIKPITIKREKVGYYEEGFVDKIASATGIRKMLLDKRYEELKELMPLESYEILLSQEANFANIEDYYHFIKFKVLNDRNSLENISDMEMGLWNRVYEKIQISENFEQFMKNFVNKRYTLSRTKRILIHILLNIKTGERDVKPPFIRALAFNDKGREYIKYLKKNYEVKVMSSNKNIGEFSEDISLFQKELDRDSIYKLVHYYVDEKFAIKKS